MAKNNIKRTNPNHMVFIYNYKDRMGDADSADNIEPFEVDQIILNTVSLLSVETSKTKSNPAGTFEFRLAPTKNWVTAITPGSWCIILMSNKAINDTAKYGGGKVDPSSFKMLGRIESVRGVVAVDPNGARQTQYVVSGKDWGTIFDTRFYVDPLNRSGDENPVGTAERFGFEEYLRNAAAYEPNKTGQDANKIPPAIARDGGDTSKKPVFDAFQFLDKGQTPTPLKDAAGPTDGNTTKSEDIRLPSAADSVEAILKLWGRSDPATSKMSNDTGLLAKSQQQFRLPKKAAEYMGFRDSSGRVSNVIAQVLEQIAGRLVGQDRYEGKDNSAGIINFSTILGDNTIWKVINDNNNGPINELIPEIRFEGRQANMVLYNRVKPFAVKSKNEIKADSKKVGDNIGAASPEVVDEFISDFKNVRRIDIDIDDVLTCNFGTNWRDKYNFIEVNIDRSLFKETFAKDIKLDSQFKDEDSIGRDGLMPMMTSFSYVPTKGGVQNALSSFAYKYLLKEWYFNTHKMLNGTMQMIGQDQYIQVGDNIIVPAEVLGPAKNISAAQKASRRLTYLLAHVESISHSGQVDVNGARTFVTTINFVRGIISDVNGNIVATEENAGAVDQDASRVTPSVEKNSGTFGTSAANDPDRQKLKGK